jgi:DNA-directed RNA polymerase subunit M/transcription elongation factor TFIIS
MKEYKNIMGDDYFNSLPKYTQEIISKIAEELKKQIYIKSKSKCPKCGEINRCGSRLLTRELFKEIDDGLATYSRTCINCNHVWETEEKRKK